MLKSIIVSCLSGHVSALKTWCWSGAGQTVLSVLKSDDWQEKGLPFVPVHQYYDGCEKKILFSEIFCKEK